MARKITKIFFQLLNYSNIWLIYLVKYDRSYDLKPFFSNKNMYKCLDFSIYSLGFES